ncbi:MAG: AMP-binding protein [Hellea sp.]|nr:AMP-binding protein [Hellea sp.]
MSSRFLNRIWEKFQNNPDKLALKWADGGCNYQQLSGRVNARMQWLRTYDLQAGDRIGLFMRKGPTTVEIILAGLAHGLIIIPIDSNSPAKRVQSILEKTTPSLLVLEEKSLAVLEHIPEGLIQHIATVDAFQCELEQGPNTPTISKISASSPALILMTSGTTGLPKGITISHENIGVFVNWALKEFNLSSSDNFVSIAPFHFDLSMLDLYGALSLGACLYLPSDSELSLPGEFAKVIERNQISVLYTVPSFLSLLTRFRVFESDLSKPLKTILFAGEVYPTEQLNQLIKQRPDIQYANLFGPTESNVFASYKVTETSFTDPVPIGQPCNHADVRILDIKGRVAGTDEVGELWVRGPTIMLGYWGEPPLNPREYFATGDHAFRDAAGLIHFSGRRDHLVKIRGHRISLLDIENIASKLTGINQAAACLIHRNGTRQHLCLDVSIDDRSGIDQKSLSAHMAAYFPKVMQPTNYKIHGQLPYTLNGKIDRQKLRAGWSKQARQV